MGTFLLQLIEYRGEIRHHGILAVHSLRFEDTKKRPSYALLGRIAERFLPPRTAQFGRCAEGSGRSV